MRAGHRNLKGLCATVAFVALSCASSSAYAACSSPLGNAGDIAYSSTQNLMVYCNGTAWVGMGASSSVSFGTLTTGDICTATSGTQISCTTTMISPAFGGTGVNNGSYTTTLGGNILTAGTLTTAGAFTTSGAFPLTLVTTGSTTATLPVGTSTLVPTTVATLSNLSIIGTITTGVWNGTAITVPYGGTGATALTAHAVMLGEGASAVATASPGTSGQVLISQGASADPAFGTLSLTSGITGVLPPANGGTGAATLTGYVYGNGTNAMTASPTIPYTALPALTANQVLGALTATTPSGLTVPGCSAASSALSWTSGTGFGCNAAINAATLGGATFASPGAIGGGTASTGAFTTVTATNFSGNGASLTNLNAANITSGILGVSYGGTGDVSLTQYGVVLGNGTGALATTAAGATGTVLQGNTGANPTFSADLTYSGLETNTFGTDYVPAGTQVAAALMGTSSSVRVTPTAATTFYGIAGGVGGRILRLHNASTYALTLSSLSSSDASANQIITGTGSDMQMLANSSVTLQYDATVSHWRVIGGSGGGVPAGTTGQVQFNSGTNTFAADSNLTWDNTNKRLGVGSATPSYAVDANAGTVAGTIVHVNSAGVTAPTGATTGGITFNAATTGQMAYYSGTNAISGTSDLYVSGSNIGIGTSTPTNLLSLLGTSAQTIWMERGTAAGNNLTVQAGGGLSGGSNENGGNLILASGISTGTGTSQIQFKVYPAGTSGSTDGTATTAMTIASGGYVGIGTTGPGTLLDVYGANTNSDMTVRSTTGRIDLWAYTDGSNYIESANAANSASETLRFTGYLNTVGTFTFNGNVGIGTTSPGHLLDVSGGSGATVQIIALGTSSGPALSLNSTGTNGHVWNLYSSQSGNIPVAGSFGIYDGTANADRLVINTSGFVGIGTTSPAVTLDVENSATAASLALADFYAPSNTTANNQTMIRVGNGGSVNNSAEIRFAPVSSGSASNAIQLGFYGTSALVEILAGGNVGIGTTAPAFPLQAANSIGIAYSNRYMCSSMMRGSGGLVIAGSADAACSSSWYYGSRAVEIDYGNGLNLEFDTANIGTWTNSALVISGRNGMQGNIGIGTTSPGYTLQVNGSVAGTSAYNNLSDVRLKKDIEPLAYGLDTVMKLRPVGFNWIAQDQAWKKQHQIGLIAQEVEPLVSEVVTTAGDAQKTKSIAYGSLVPVLIKGEQQLKALLDDSTQKVETIFARLASHDSAIQELKSSVGSDHEALAKLKADNVDLRSANDNQSKSIADLRIMIEKQNQDFAAYKKAHP